MSTLADTLARIHPADEAAMSAALTRWNSLAKPVGGLGMLEDVIVRIAGITGTRDVCLNKRELIITCADNGVVRQGVSASDASITRLMAQAIAAGTSTSSLMARRAKCSVIPIDVGMREGSQIPGVRMCAIRPEGTDDISCGPAMSVAECMHAIELGIELVAERKQAGASILLVGEMGIGNTTTSCAVACALYGHRPQELVGPGTGISVEGVSRKAAVIEKALSLNQPQSDDPLDVLYKVGGFDIATICGICLGGARYRVPILLDGIITLAGAACAVRLAPNCRSALLPSHVSAEPIARLLLDELGMQAPLHANMHLGEGTGALAMLPLLDMALEVYQNGYTLHQLDIDGYAPALEGGNPCSRSS